MRRAVLAAAVLLAVGTGGAWWWAHPPDPGDELRSRRLELVALVRQSTRDLGPNVERWRMVVADGDTVRGIWKPGIPPTRGAGWSVIVLGGLDTDDRAALLAPDPLSDGVLAVSWPWAGPRRMAGPELVANVPAIRQALLRTPAAIALAVEAARSARPGARVALLGASLGVPPTAAALALTTPDALILVDGAADLRGLLRAEITRAVNRGVIGSMVAEPAAALGARLLWSLEPARHAAPAGVPVLIIDAEDEGRYPPACIERLHAAFPTAERRTHPGPHLRPSRPEAIAAIVREVDRWLDGLDATHH